MSTLEAWRGGFFLNTHLNEDDDRAESLAAELDSLRYPDEGCTEPAYQLLVRVHLKNIPDSHAETLDGLYREDALYKLAALADHYYNEYQTIQLGGKIGRALRIHTFNTDAIAHVQAMAVELDRPNPEDVRRRKFTVDESQLSDQPPKTWNEDRAEAERRAAEGS